MLGGCRGRAERYAVVVWRASGRWWGQFAGLAGAGTGERALDVGGGAGAVWAKLVGRLGSDAVSAGDPAESFVAAIRARFPQVDVRTAVAEELPFRDESFDLAHAQLVVHFMTDHVAGLVQMARVARPAGLVAAWLWCHGGGRHALTAFSR
mgnify:CR=1 FL=1